MSSSNRRRIILSQESIVDADLSPKLSTKQSSVTLRKPMIMMGGVAASNLDGEETEFEDISKVKQKAI